MALPAPRADRQAAATRRAAARLDLLGVPAVRPQARAVRLQVRVDRLQARVDRLQVRVDRLRVRVDRQVVVISIVDRARPVRIDPTAATAKIDPREAIATIDRRAPR